MQVFNFFFISLPVEKKTLPTALFCFLLGATPSFAQATSGSVLGAGGGGGRYTLVGTRPPVCKAGAQSIENLSSRSRNRLQRRALLLVRAQTLPWLLLLPLNGQPRGLAWQGPGKAGLAQAPQGTAESAGDPIRSSCTPALRTVSLRASENELGGRPSH